MKAIDSASNFIRAMVSLVIVGIVGFAGWIGYSMLNDAKQAELAIKELEETKNRLEEAEANLRVVSEKLIETETALRLLKVDRRVALIEIDRQYETEDGRTMTELRFIEMEPDGKRPVAAVSPGDLPGKPFKIETDIIHISTLVAKFKDEYVEAGDPLRGASICLLQSIYGDNQAPSEGEPLDEVGTRPIAYGKGAMSEFEAQIWEDFWELANDPEKADQMGIRAASGEAPFIRVREGMTYKLELRASGGLTLTPEPRSNLQMQE